MIGDDALLPPRPRRRRWLRRLVTVVAVLVVLFVVLLGAGGWYYAGQIESEALAAQPNDGTVGYELEVLSYDGATVVLRRSGAPVEHDALRTADTYGLQWPGGAGIVSGSPQFQDGGGVGRALRVIRGALPEPGAKASLELDVWDDPTEAYGVPFSEVTYPCPGGACPAWLVAGTSTTWLVQVHGKGATREEPLRAAGPAIEAGLPVLDIGYRNDADAPADPSGRYGYGATEWHDLEAAVGYAVDHGARHVVLFGSSMGGAIVAAFLQHSASASLVSGVVLDAPALDLRAAVALGADQRTLPVIGTGIPDVLTATAEWIAGRRYDLDWNAVDYLPGDWLTVPALVFHGSADDTVPIATSDQLRAAHPDLVREVRVDGAPHVGSWNADPQRYTAEESAFLACVTAPTPARSCTG